MRCPQCGASVRPGARFCGACGCRLSQLETQPQVPPAQPPLVAPDYHSRLAAYTPKHLTDKILTTRSALEGERRVVTVLFTDTAGFTDSLATPTLTSPPYVIGTAVMGYSTMG